MDTLAAVKAVQGQKEALLCCAQRSEAVQRVKGSKTRFSSYTAFVCPNLLPAQIVAIGQ